MKNYWASFRTTNFLFGLFTALTIVVAVFNYTVYETEASSYIPKIIQEDEDIKIIRTPARPIHKKKIPLPKKIETIAEVIPEPSPEIVPPDFIEPTIIVDSTALIDTSTTLSTTNDIPLPPAPKPLPLPTEDGPDEIVNFASQTAYYGNCINLEDDKNERKKCSDLAFFNYLRKNISYPTIAHENGIEGIVYIEIIISKKGELESAKIIKDIGGGCGKEALRVIQKMGKWSAAKQGNVPVRLRMKLPVKFTLQ